LDAALARAATGESASYIEVVGGKMDFLARLPVAHQRLDAMYANGYPSLAQLALREAKVLARNIVGALDGRTPEPFVYATLGMMGSLGHAKAFGQLLGIRVRGVLAWLIRRAYYLLQMPGWRRRLRILIDWAFTLLFRPDVVKISLDSEEGERHEAAGVVAEPREQGAARNGPDTGSHPLTTGGGV
jgi:hypothetical protein